MRIAYMLTSLGIGGAEQQVVALAERMSAHGHDVALIVLRSAAARQWPTALTVVYLDMTKSPATLPGAFMRGRRFLRSFQPDILHSHTFPANMAARILRAMGATPTVLATIHNIYEGGLHRTIAYRLTDMLCVHTTAVSQAVADRYVEMRAVPRNKCSVVTNGIDAHHFSSSSQGGSRAREFMHAEDDFIWLGAGRLVPAKDFDNLVAAFRQVRAEIPDMQLWIAGELDEPRWVRIGGEVVGTERYEAEGIRWLGFCEDMAATMAPVDAFVLSSAWEGMPLVVGEAMAMEKPVVATDVGGVRELVEDAGMLVPAKDPDALAKAMQRVMNLPRAERDAMGHAARSRICAHFDMNAKAAEWEALYSNLLSHLR
jgi:glycosyltransferase involved in cell wall biosynthesis